VTFEAVHVALKNAVSGGAYLHGNENYRSRGGFYTWNHGVSIPEEPFKQLAQVLYDHTPVRNYEGNTLASGDGLGERIDLMSITRWLVAEALRRNDTEAPVRELLAFLERPSGESLRVRLLHGLQIVEPIHLADGYSLVPFRSIPPSVQKVAAEAICTETSQFRVGLPLPSALIYRRPLQRILFPYDAPPQDFEGHKKDAAEAEKRFEAVFSVLSLFGPPAVFDIGNWWQAGGPGVPAMGAQSLFWNHETPIVQKNAICEPSLALTLSSNILKIIDAGKEGEARKRARGLVRALRRINLSMRELNPGDAYIDNRIALECGLLGQGAESEKSYRLSIYGAALLAPNGAERKAFYDALSLAYKRGSDVVHDGELKEKDLVDAHVHVREAQALTLKILKELVLREGLIDFDKLVLDNPTCVQGTV